MWKEEYNKWLQDFREWKESNRCVNWLNVFGMIFKSIEITRPLDVFRTQPV